MHNVLLQERPDETAAHRILTQSALFSILLDGHRCVQKTTHGCSTVLIIGSKTEEESIFVPAKCE
jgi:hypothetical protein